MANPVGRPTKYSDDLKEIKAKYRALTRDLQRQRKAYNFLTDKTSVGGLVVMEKTNEA